MNTRTQIEGMWNLVVGTPRGDRPVNLRLVCDGAAVSGTMNDIAIEDGAWATVDGDRMSGKAKVGRLPITVPVSGTREAA